MRRRDAGPQELPALDPDTGEVLVPGDEARLSPPPRRPSPARRLRRIALVLAGLSVCSAAGAGYAGTTVASLRRVERAWLTATALDGQRGAAEERVITGLRSFGETDEAAGLAIRRLGEDEARRLAGLESELRDATIIDRGVSRLRDGMVRALRFRRAALTTNRLQLDDRELRPLTARLADSRERWRVPPRKLSAPPPLAEADRALRRLAQFADEPTGTVLVGRSNSGIVVVDIDASSLRRRPAPGLTGLFGWGELVVASGNGQVTAYPTELTQPPRWSVAGTSAFPAVEPDRIWVGAADGLRLVDGRGGVVSGPVALPAQRSAVGATTGGLVLTRSSGGIELWDPATRKVVQAVTGTGRLVAASRNFVAWQEPTDTLLRVTEAAPSFGDRHYRLRRTDAGAGAFSPDGSLLAVTAGPAAGAIARVLIVETDGPAVHAVGGPSTTFADASLAWSADGEWLFWKTREGRIALQRRGTREVRILRADVADLLSFAAAEPAA